MTAAVYAQGVPPGHRRPSHALGWTNLALGRSQQALQLRADYRDGQAGMRLASASH